MKRWLRSITFACIFSLSVPAFASMVTLSIVQNEEAPSTAIETSRILEDELFSLFFSMGTIVTNIDIGMDGSRFKDPLYSVKEASWGGSDYLLVIYLEYKPEEKEDETEANTETETEIKKPGPVELISISWRLVHVMSAKTLETGETPKGFRGISETDPAKKAQILANQLYPLFNTAISKAKKGGF